MSQHKPMTQERIRHVKEYFDLTDKFCNGIRLNEIEAKRFDELALELGHYEIKRELLAEVERLQKLLRSLLIPRPQPKTVSFNAAEHESDNS